jgi:DNA-binding response OmpR family regulator
MSDPVNAPAAGAPAAGAPAAGAPAAGAPAAEPRAAPAPPPAKVLIVDDEPNILLSLKFLMTKAGYNVRTAKDGEEALAEVGRFMPDVMLLDVMMPKIDGFTVCQRVKSAPDTQGVRIVMLTARGRDVERQKGLQLGADDYITKPFSTKDALDRVAALLQHRTASASASASASAPAPAPEAAGGGSSAG